MSLPKGYRHSEETKRKIRLTKIGLKASEESKKKMSISSVFTHLGEHWNEDKHWNEVKKILIHKNPVHTKIIMPCRNFFFKQFI